jgi:glycerol-1-phosphate dehydrogenase [NAD(P)+]
MSDGFTKTRAMNFPRQVLAGHGCIGQIGEMCEDFGLKGTALIVTGPTTGSLAANQVKDALLQKKYDVQQIEVGIATQLNLIKVEEVAKDVKASFLHPHRTTDSRARARL